MRAWGQLGKVCFLGLGLGLGFWEEAGVEIGDCCGGLLDEGANASWCVRAQEAHEAKQRLPGLIKLLDTINKTNSKVTKAQAMHYNGLSERTCMDQRVESCHSALEQGRQSIMCVSNVYWWHKF
jgi:hypothetical protein